MRDVESIFDNLLTVQELLAMLKGRYSVHTVYRWVQRCGMPHKRIRGKLWFPKAEVIQWLERSNHERIQD
jgi:excisionase family DNA binding protein